jgi:predicted nucleotidyltransferase
MTDAHRLLRVVVEALDRMGVRHALIGAAALAAHGVARSTFDMDLLTTDVTVLDPKAWEDAALDPTWTVDVRRGDADDPLAGVVRVSGSDQADIDIVVGRYGWQTAAVERAGISDLGRLRIRVVRAEDLVLLKLFAGGAQDLWDVEQLLAVANREAIAAGVDARIGQLPASAHQAWVRLKGRL